MKLEIIPIKYLEKYKKAQPITLQKHFNKVKKQPYYNTYGYSFAISSVYSSMIEGNIIDVDTYLKYVESGMNQKNKSFREIQDLKKAYEFAKSRVLNYKNFLEVHSIITKTVIREKKYRGRIRDKDVYIFSKGQKIYTGASAKIVHEEIEKLFDDIAILRKRKLTITEVFYYASMIHLIIAKIHPFADGNGRTARLIEKWFLADSLGSKAWFIQTEKLYQNRIRSYYKNIHIGINYNKISFNASLAFLKMLPMALRIK